MTSTTIDKDWFLRRLGDNNKSVRGLARHLNIDASAASRMLSGERRMKMDEASSIAQFLGVHVKDVLKHAGVAIDLDGMPTRILLVATVTEDGSVVYLREPRPLPQSIIDRAHAAIGGASNERIIAAQIRADKGPLAIIDDAVLLFRQTDSFDQSSIGTLSIARTTAGEVGIGKILRARKTGEAIAAGVDGKIYERDIVAATPILAIIP